MVGFEPTISTFTEWRLNQFVLIHHVVIPGGLEPPNSTFKAWWLCQFVYGTLYCLSDGTRTHIELLHSFLIPNQVGDQLPTHLVIVEPMRIELILLDFQSSALTNLATVPICAPQKIRTLTKRVGTVYATITPETRIKCTGRHFVFKFPLLIFLICWNLPSNILWGWCESNTLS